MTSSKTRPPVRAPTALDAVAIALEPPPVLAKAELADLAAGWLERPVIDVRTMSSEKDHTAAVEVEGGRRYVLKVSNPSEALESVDFQARAMAHVHEAHPDLVPASVPDAGGALVGRTVDRLGRTCAARMMTMTHGEDLRGRLPSAALRTELARLLAAIDMALASFAHPADAAPLMWNSAEIDAIAHLADEAPREDRALIAEELAYFSATTRPQLRDLRAQVVHNDLNTTNAKVDHATGSVCGILDFGDATRAPLVNDVAVAASYLTDGATSLGAVGAFVRDYSAVLPLAPNELHAIPDLMRARCLTTLLVTGWRARLFPDNASYIQRNAPTHRRLLTSLRTDPTALQIPGSLLT